MATFHVHVAAIFFISSILATVSLTAAEPAASSTTAVEQSGAVLENKVARRVLGIPDVEDDAMGSRRMLPESAQWGGGGGTGFYDVVNQAAMDIQLRCGTVVDAISYKLGGVGGSRVTRGGGGGNIVAVTVDYTKPYKVQVWTGKKADENVIVVLKMVISQTTSQGTKVISCGNEVSGNTLNSITGKITAVKGRSGRYLDAIGFIYL